MRQYLKQYYNSLKDMAETYTYTDDELSKIESTLDDIFDMLVDIDLKIDTLEELSEQVEANCEAYSSANCDNEWVCNEVKYLR